MIRHGNTETTLRIFEEGKGGGGGGGGRGRSRSRSRFVSFIIERDVVTTLKLNIVCMKVFC